MISRAVSAPSAHHADPDVDRPSGYAHGCAQITRFGTASGDRHSDLVAEHIGGSNCEALIGGPWRSVTAGVLRPRPAARWSLGQPMPATVPAGSCGVSATGYRDARFCDPEAPGRLSASSGIGPRADLPGSRQFAGPLCVTHRPIRRLPGWLPAMSAESPQALPRTLAGPGYGCGFWPDGVWRSS